MGWTIIAASSEGDQLAELKKGAQEIEAKIRSSGGSARVLEAISVEDVRRLRDDPHDTRTELIITTASLSESQSAPNSQKLPGLNFVKELQASLLPPACILVSEYPEHWAEVRGMKRCRWLPVGPRTNYIEDCALLAKDLDVWAPRVEPPDPDLAASEVYPQLATACEPYALIEVDLPSDAKFATVRRVVRYANGLVDSTPATPLGLNQRKVDELVNDSRKLSEQFTRALKGTSKFLLKWQADYRSLGERFYKLLDTDVFAEHLAFAKGAAAGQGVQDVRLRFSLGRLVFDGLWESICDSKGRHLMLDSTITRRDRDSIDSFLGGRAGAVGILNVLVIGAAVDDNSAPDGPNDVLWKKFWAASRLAALPHIDKEIEALEALAGSTSGAAPLQIQVDVLSGAGHGGGAWSLAEEVKERLDKEPKRYDVIHFAGHALFTTVTQKNGATDKRKSAADRRNKITVDDRGYLIFSGAPKPRAVPIATVASWLKDTSVELVYLSCCRSSASRAAAEFARNSIRTTIGFSWDLDDGKAVDFAKFFYEGLLKNRLNVCSAIRKAREKLYNEFDTGDPIWASPVLLAQPQDWLHVEGVLRPPVRPTGAVAGGPPSPGFSSPAGAGQSPPNLSI